MNCSKCSGKMAKKRGETPEGVEYSYFSCEKCGEEVLNLEQLEEVAKKYAEMKKYSVKISQWGESLAMRFPRDLAKKYGLKKNEKLTLVPEKNSIKIIA